MKFKLNVLDRLIIPNLLPKESTTIEQAAIKEIRKMIRLKSEDFAKHGIIEDPVTKNLDPTTLDPEENPKVLEVYEYDFNKTQTQIMKDAAIKIEDDKKVSQFNLETVVRLKAMR